MRTIPSHPPEANRFTSRAPSFIPGPWVSMLVREPIPTAGDQVTEVTPSG